MLETSTQETDREKQNDAVRSNILFTIGVILLLLLAWTLQKELFIVYVSALFAAVLMPMVNVITSYSIRGRHPSRLVAIVVLILAVVLVLFLFLFFGLPPVLKDLTHFADDLPNQIPVFLAKLHHLPFVDRLNVAAVAARAEGALTATASYLVTSLPLWLSHLFDILTAAFLCLYFMLEGEDAYHFFLSLFRRPFRTRLDATLQRANQKISKWLFGQGLLMLILGVSSTIAFGLLHVRYFLLLGFLMGLFNIIPVAGGIITIVLAVGVAALDSWTKMLGVIVFYVVYVNIENAYLIPRIMRSSVDLAGLTILIALLFGTALAGIPGALVAVPTAALIAVLLEEYAVQKDPA
jgi:predicted PurR-regulated permease PerM